MTLVDSICNSCDVLADFPQLFYIPDLPQLFCIPGKEGIEFFAIERRKTEKELIWADPIWEEAQKVSILDPIGIVVIESGLLIKLRRIKVWTILWQEAGVQRSSRDRQCHQSAKISPAPEWH